MGKKRYLSVDGGGTKLLSLLFDDELRLLSVGRSGAINPNFLSLDAIRSHMEESISQCLASEPSAEIETLWISMPGPAALYERLLKKRCRVLRTVVLSEGDTCLLAGLCRRTGLVVLCGTGASLFYVTPGRPAQARGGWGGPIGDEGSGYEIGNRAIRAAIWAQEGRGPKTLLENRVLEKLGGGDLREAMSALYQSGDIRGFIAGFCGLVGECAREGDLIAGRILTMAGEQAALQAEAFLRQAELPPDVPVVTSGGAWKGKPLMYQSFVNHLSSAYPRVRISPPKFDPIMGPVVGLALSEEEALSEDCLQLLTERFPEFVCDRSG